jgi:hypothetical protein
LAGRITPCAPVARRHSKTDEQFLAWKTPARQQINGWRDLPQTISARIPTQ